MAVAVALGCARAHADPTEDFVQAYIQKGLSILGDASLTHAQKHAQFEALLLPMTDMRRVALYTLGPLAKTAPPDQVEQFVQVFGDLEMSLYERELWRLQELKVEAAVARTPGDAVVQSFQLDAKGDRSVNADEIDFRVLGTDKPVIVDYCVRGAWLAVNQKTQYAEFLAEPGNDLPALIRKLRNRANKMNRYLAGGEVEPRPVHMNRPVAH